ncbi:uncharacterized protein LOC116444082 [Corvus moneduloides]|uniref:uncharacterized protein LOC116444082 n=1 Tax=Corvus moneduloides TaxID=1196302 RepID=UPI001362D07B|nr:uncharacterized protein LOC116444082 [Corvus moneduloides]
MTRLKRRGRRGAEGFAITPGYPRAGQGTCRSSRAVSGGIQRGCGEAKPLLPQQPSLPQPPFCATVHVFLRGVGDFQVQRGSARCGTGAACGPGPLPAGSLRPNSPGFQFVPTPAWDARWPHGVECPWDIPPSPSPTAPEPLSGCARQPAATQRAGRSGHLGPGSVGNRQTEGYIWGRKRVWPRAFGARTFAGAIDPQRCGQRWLWARAPCSLLRVKKKAVLNRSLSC